MIQNGERHWDRERSAELWERKETETRAGSVSGLHLGANGVFPKWTFRKFSAVRHCLAAESRGDGAGKASAMWNQSACLPRL